MSIFGALNSSVTGLRAQSDALGIISDNISNTNTTGYKANTAEFSHLVTAAATETSYNPGGVQLRPGQEVQKQGILDSSDISTDLAIEGNGLFAVKDAAGDIDANEFKYTRTGNFRVNENGNLENANGFLLQGWKLSDDANGDQALPPDKDNLGSLQTVEVDNFSGIARATENLSIGAQLPPNLDPSETRSMTARIFDAEGTPQNVKLEFTRDAGNGDALSGNQYRMDIHAPVDSEDPESPQSGLFELDTAIDPGTVTVGESGASDTVNNIVTGAGNLVSSDDRDLDGDGADEARASIYEDADGNRVRLINSNGGPDSTTGGPGGDVTLGAGADKADIVEIEQSGNQSFEAGKDLRLAISPGALDGNDDPTAAATFDRTSRLSNVVQFNGDGAIRTVGENNANLESSPGKAELQINSNDDGELNLSLDFARQNAVPAGSDATEPQNVSLNVGTPLDPDGDGTDENDKQLDGLTNFASGEGFDVRKLEQDGLQFGDFTGVSVDESGIVTAEFSNGERRDVAQIPVTTFNNPNGLESQSGTVFVESPESGEAQLQQAGVGGAGTIAPSALESSTVELATQFTKMIETQRAYSASTRVVTTSDEMLQTITNATR